MTRPLLAEARASNLTTLPPEDGRESGVSFLVFLGNYNCVQETGQGKVPTLGIPLPLLFLRNAREIYESLIIASEVHLDTPTFW